jgi:hypothetical protein
MVRRTRPGISRFPDVQLHIRFDAFASPGMTKADNMTPTEIDKIFRDEAGRAMATLIRLVGDFDLA